MRITLLTDFGTADGYIAAMKGVIAQIAPSALIDDVSHAVPPGDITGAAHALRRYWKLYPEGTVHVAVIDPGVGSSRRGIVVHADQRFVVGPDNGIATFVLGDAREKHVVEITNSRYTRGDVSRTFHGRDVFAPVAAHLSNGLTCRELGPDVTDPVTIPNATPLVTEHAVHGEIATVDRFGNLVTNIAGSYVKQRAVVEIGGAEVRVVATYADAEAGEAVALINSDGVLEIAMRNENAADTIGAGRGDMVVLRLG